MRSGSDSLKLFSFELEVLSVSQHFYFSTSKSHSSHLPYSSSSSLFGLKVTYLNNFIWDLLHTSPLPFSFLFIPFPHPLPPSCMPVIYPLPVFSHSLVSRELVNLNGLSEAVAREDEGQLATVHLDLQRRDAAADRFNGTVKIQSTYHLLSLISWHYSFFFLPNLIWIFGYNIQPKVCGHPNNVCAHVLYTL